MKRELREAIYLKYCGHCAYCGRYVRIKEMQIDHIVPIRRGHPGWREREKAAENICDLNPACPRCNRWKGVYSVEDFRREVDTQHTRLYRDSAGYRLAWDFSTISVRATTVFEFERPRYKK